MDRLLRLLIVEDNADDAELIIYSLRRGGLEPTWKRVESADELIEELASATWDAVLSDFTLPAFGAAAALEIVRSIDLDLPFVVISGTVGDDLAVGLMRAGANDYVLKHNLVRLAPVLERELREAENRRARRAAERLGQDVLDSLSSLVAVLDAEGTIIGVNAAWKHFADTHGAKNCGVGTNYLGGCQGAYGAYAQDADAAANGILGVLRGEVASFSLEYPCNSPSEQRWSILQVTPLLRVGRGAVISHTDISERKRAEEILAFSETRYRRLFEAARDGILILDATSGKILEVNPFLTHLLGYQRDEMVGKELWEIGAVRNIEASRESYRTLLEEGYIRYDNQPLVARDGREIDVEFVSNTYDAAGVLKVQCNNRDITDRKRAEKALGDSEVRYRTLVTAAAAIVWDSPASGEFDSEQPAWTAFTGQTVEQHRGWGWLNVIHPDDREKSARAWAAALRQGSIYQVEHRIRRADGEYRHMSARAVPILEPPSADGSRAIREWVGVHTDVTEQKLAQELLRASEERFRAFMDHSPAVADIKDEQGRFLYVNASWRRQFEQEPADWQGKTNYEYWPRESADIFKASDQHCLAQNAAIESEETVQTAAGMERTMLVIKVPFLDAGLRRIGGMAWDITARRQAEQALRTSERRFQHVLASSPAMLFTLAVVDNQFLSINWVSDNVTAMFGYSPEEAFASNWWQDNIHPESRAQVILKFHGELIAHGHSIQEYRFRHRDGHYRWISSERRLIRDAKGRPVEVVGAWSDITDHKRLEDQFNQAQKMEAFGQLAGGVAHDFNNLLTIINGYSDLLLQKLPSSERSREMITQIRTAGERSAGLTRQLLAFSRKQILATQTLDLNVVVNDTGKMLHRLIGEDIRLATILEPKLWQVQADPGQIEQVLMNLAVNARDAMPRGGRLTIETQNIELDEAHARKHVDARPGAYVLLSVADTGSGIPAEVLARIFEPFFTTKEVGKGTGLGLATVHGIVKQSDGFLSVQSEVGMGTTFSVFLPRTENASAATKSPSTLRDPPKGTETVLLAEDEEGLRKLAAHILVACGYHVLEAIDGNDAARRAAEYPGPIHLLITDVVMPGPSGRAVFEQLAKVRPDLRVLFMSGYTDDAVIRHGIMRNEVNFLQKPFSPFSLAAKVREVLDAS
jgi:PAS domain S-box-containing protein